MGGYTGRQTQALTFAADDPTGATMKLYKDVTGNLARLCEKKGFHPRSAAVLFR